MQKRDISVREVALTCLMSISRTRASVTAVIDSAFRKHALSGRERRLVNGLVYGVVRWQKQLDWVLNRFINPRFQVDMRHRNILRLGAFQLLHLDGIPAHAAIFETVQLAKKAPGPDRKSGPKTAGFINGVLRSVQRKAHTLTYPPLGENPVEHISLSLSYPTWMVKRWIEERGVSWTLAFCSASNQVAPLSLRVNSLVTQREELRQSLAASGIATRLSQIATDGLILETLASSADENTLKALLNREDIYVQDESAMLVAPLVTPLVAPENMQLIVELCAAPGGKTTHLAHLMGNSGKIIAIDISDKRLAVLEKNCRRVGALNVETEALDATTAEIGFIANADAVLIDAPCSGFGTLRRHADIRWNRTTEHLRTLREVQLNLLRNAAPHLKRGGVLVYSTCSIEPQENEAIIRRFLAEFPMYTVEHARTFLPHLPPSALTPGGFVQTFPHEHGVDGAFAARLRRNT